MLTYYLIEIICEYLDDVKDRYNLHLTCQYYYTIYRDEGNLCWDCNIFSDKWEIGMLRCDICHYDQHIQCGKFKIFNNRLVCQYCYINRCESCFQFRYDNFECLYCEMIVGYCCVHFYGIVGPLGTNTNKDTCICVMCRDKIIYTCRKCLHRFDSDGPTYVEDVVYCDKCDGECEYGYERGCFWSYSY